MCFCTEGQPQSTFSEGSPSVSWEGGRRKPKKKATLAFLLFKSNPRIPSVERHRATVRSPPEIPACASSLALHPPSISSKVPLFNQNLFLRAETEQVDKKWDPELDPLSVEKSCALGGFFALKWRESICKWNRREMNKQRNSEMNKQCKKVKSATVEILLEIKMRNPKRFSVQTPFFLLWQVRCL